MSVIRKKPFIQTLVEDLTEAQKASLLGVMNGSGSTEEVTFGDLPEDAIAPVLFKFSEVDSKTGILIQSDNYTVLIAYHRFQDLLMFKINSNNTYEKINEYLDINELRNLLEDSGDVVIGDDLAVGGKLEVTGTSEFKDSVEFKDDAEFKGDIAVADDSKVSVFSNIVDSDNHNRFVSGNITLNEVTGLTQTFGKWALSGNHLRIELSISIANGASIPNETKLATVNIPTWMFNKITPMIGAMVEYKGLTFWSEGLGSQTGNILLRKGTTLDLYYYTTFTATAARAAKIFFDLIID